MHLYGLLASQPNPRVSEGPCAVQPLLLAVMVD
jgi:hypothetical protein